MVLLILIGSLAGSVAMVLGARDLVAASGTRRRAVQAIVGDELYAGTDRLERWDRLFRGTRLGRRMERELVLAGVAQRPITVFAGGVLAAAVTAFALWTLLAPLLGVLGLTAGFFAVRIYLGRERSRRLEAFVAQMPELARVLANATNAGLSIRTAIGVAGEELDEPARTEMRRVASRLNFGSTLDRALSEMHERLPSREIAVLSSTLVVSARSGGSLVSALRDIAETLESRKETRREIRTTLAQALATGYLVIAMGFVILLVLNLLYPGVVEKMTQDVVGQAALGIAALLFTGGLIAIRRMTRIDL
jgi:tight adherence protein B